MFCCYNYRLINLKKFFHKVRLLLMVGDQRRPPSKMAPLQWYSTKIGYFFSYLLPPESQLILLENHRSKSGKVIKMN